MPLSISRRERRRAPTTEIDGGIAADDERGEKKERSEGGHYRPAAVSAALAASYFDGHFAITPFGSAWNPSGVEPSLQHDLGLVLERVGHDAGVGRLDHVADSFERAVVLHLEPVLERVGLPQNRAAARR